MEGDRTKGGDVETGVPDVTKVPLDKIMSDPAYGEAAREIVARLVAVEEPATVTYWGPGPHVIGGN